MGVGDITRLAVTTLNRNSFEQLVNVFHYKNVDGIFEPTDPLDLIAAWRDRAEASYAGVMSSNNEIIKLEARMITGGADVAETFLNPPVPGGQGGDIMAQQTCPLISWRTGQAGRSFRGRSYLPVTSEVNLDNGFFVPSYVTVMEAFGTEAVNLAGSPTHATWQMVIWSRVLSSGTDVTSFIARNIPATQRSRRIGVGS